MRPLLGVDIQFAKGVDHRGIKTEDIGVTLQSWLLLLHQRRIDFFQQQRFLAGHQIIVVADGAPVGNRMVGHRIMKAGADADFGHRAMMAGQDRGG